MECVALLTSVPSKDEDSDVIQRQRGICERQEERSSRRSRDRQAHGPLGSGGVWTSPRPPAPVRENLFSFYHSPDERALIKDELRMSLGCREKANLAVTLANKRDDVVAHASLLDHPVTGLVDQSQWETFLKENFAAQECTVRIVMIPICDVDLSHRSTLPRLSVLQLSRMTIFQL